MSGVCVYTNGAYIKPFLDTTSGKWVWIVVAFEDDTFKDGDTIDPDVISETEEGLYRRPGVED